MKDEELIKKGFNHGYELQKRSPFLAVQIASGFRDHDKPYEQGFISGSIECIKELKQDVKIFLAQINKSNDIGHGKSQDLEFER